jgi:hypothetical protein
MELGYPEEDIATQAGIYAGLAYELGRYKQRHIYKMDEQGQPTNIPTGYLIGVGFKARPNTLGVDDPRVADVSVLYTRRDDDHKIAVSVRDRDSSQRSQTIVEGTLYRHDVDDLTLRQLALLAFLPFPEYLSEFRHFIGEGIFKVQTFNTASLTP